MTSQKIAIVGGGISGLSALYYLSKAGYQCSLFEKNDYIGGHANTIDVPYTDTNNTSIAVDTGFIVYNPNNYPQLISLFDELGVETIASDMSFAASIDGLEYGSRNLSEIFAQRRNIFKPQFYKMLFDILRFYKEAENVLASDTTETLGEYLSNNNYSNIFIDKHIIPMGAAIWSTPDAQMMEFPIKTFVQFFKNHELLKTKNRPVWRTVKGGSREYVKKLLAKCDEGNNKPELYASSPVQSVVRRNNGIEVQTNDKHHTFGKIVMASHTDETLKMLENPSQLEQEVLSAFKYQPNTAFVHRDQSLMPKCKKAWSSWNYLSSNNGKLALTYWMNRLQSLPGQDLFVTLNPPTEPDQTIRKIQYHHPVYDADAIAAWDKIPQIQGTQNTYYAGAWQGYGFHEDGVVSGKRVAELIGSAA